jgi:predicted MFS family arabinose efflux permease
MPLALCALTTGAFGIGVAEFVITDLILEVCRNPNIAIASALAASGPASARR